MNMKGPGLSLPELTIYTICQSFRKPALENLVLVRGEGKAVIFHTFSLNFGQKQPIGHCSVILLFPPVRSC